MFPIICKIGPLNIYAYGLMLVSAFFVSSTLAIREAKKRNIASDVLFDFLFGVFIAGILGARIFYVVEHIGYYYRNPLEIIMLQRGGLSWFGGLIFGVVYGVADSKKKKLEVLKILDLVPYLALGQAIGRIGCLLNGCCHGKVSEYGIYFPAHNATLIPVQIYSSLAMAVIFIILRLMQARRKLLPGKIFFTYLFLYSLKRFSIEFFRADNSAIFYGLTLFQILSILMFLGAIAGYAALCFASKTGKSR